MHKIYNVRTILICGLLVATIAISAFIIMQSTAQTAIKVAKPNSQQFNIDIAYAYVGQHDEPANPSLTGNLVSSYPSAILLNCTRNADNLQPDCDAIIEVYGLHVTTDTGETENYAYFIGTDCGVGFTTEKLPTLSQYISNLVDKDVYTALIGDFKVHWQPSSSQLSHRIGSAGLYSSGNSTLGLWNSGEPTKISITVERIGYLTLTKDSVMEYKDATIKTVSASQLDIYGQGFLKNNIVPADTLPEKNLFEPLPQNQTSNIK